MQLASDDERNKNVILKTMISYITDLNNDSLTYLVSFLLYLSMLMGSTDVLTGLGQFASYSGTFKVLSFLPFIYNNSITISVFVLTFFLNSDSTFVT